MAHRPLTKAEIASCLIRLGYRNLANDVMNWQNVPAECKADRLTTIRMALASNVRASTPDEIRQAKELISHD